MVHWQDLAMAIKWFLFSEIKGKRNIFGFFESVWENDYRGMKPKEEEVEERPFANSKLRFLKDIQRKRKRNRHKDGYLFFADQNTERLLGTQVETVLKEFYDLENSSEKITFQNLENENEEMFKLSVESPEKEFPFSMSYPYGFRKNQDLNPVRLFNNIFKRNFQIKRSVFLDRALTSKPWERLLQETKENSLPLDKLHIEEEDNEDEEEEEIEEGGSEGEEMVEPDEEEFDLDREESAPESDQESEEEDLMSAYKGSKASLNKLTEIDNVL
jgi:hypothetical protein